MPTRGVHVPLYTRAFLLAAAANAALNLASALFLHFPGFLQSLGAGEAQIGWLLATHAFGALLAWPLVGRAMDTRGRREVILSGVVLFVIVILLYLTIESLGPRLYFVRVLDGAAAAMWYTALFTQAADLVPVQRRIEGLAIFGISGLLPVAAGAQFGDAILAVATYREVFLGALVLAVVGGVLCLQLQNVRSDHARPASPRSVRVTAVERDLVPVWLAGLAFFIAAAAIFGFMKTFVLETGLLRVGVFFTAYAGVAVSLRVFLGWLPDRVGAHRTLGLAMSAYAAGLLVLMVADSSALVVLAALLCGAGHGYTYPVLLSLVVGRTHFSERGMATAFFTSLDWFAHLVAGPAVGSVIEAAGYREAFMSLAALLTIGIAAFYALDRRPLPAS